MDEIKFEGYFSCRGDIKKILGWKKTELNRELRWTIDGEFISEKKIFNDDQKIRITIERVKK